MNMQLPNGHHNINRNSLTPKDTIYLTGVISYSALTHLPTEAEARRRFENSKSQFKNLDRMRATTTVTIFDATITDNMGNPIPADQWSINQQYVYESCFVTGSQAVDKMTKLENLYDTNGQRRPVIAYTAEHRANRRGQLVDFVRVNPDGTASYLELGKDFQGEFARDQKVTLALRTYSVNGNSPSNVAVTFDAIIFHGNPETMNGVNSLGFNFDNPRPNNQPIAVAEPVQDLQAPVNANQPFVSQGYQAPAAPQVYSYSQPQPYVPPQNAQQPAPQNAPQGYQPPANQPQGIVYDPNQY